MKKSNSEIEQDFAVQINELRKIENIRSELIKTTLKTDELLAAAAMCWGGQQAERFFKKAEIIRDDISKDANRLENVENEIRRITYEYIRAEQQAEQTAQNRQGG